MNVPMLCGDCLTPILSTTKSGKCLECRQRTGSKRPRPAVQYVYLIGGTGCAAVKIGLAARPNDRLAALCRTSDTTKIPPGVDRSRLRIIYAVEGSKELERHLQRRFRHRQIVGEWFDLGSPDEARRRFRAEVDDRSVAPELDLNTDESGHVTGLVHALYAAVADPSTRAALRSLFPAAFPLINATHSDIDHEYDYALMRMQGA